MFTAPFELNDAGTNVAYRGNRDVYSVSISNSESVAVNQNGGDLFKGETDIFDTFIAVRDALINDDGSELTNLIEDVDAAVQMGVLHGEVGGRMQRLELAERQLTEVHTQLSELISRRDRYRYDSDDYEPAIIPSGDGGWAANECANSPTILTRFPMIRPTEPLMLKAVDWLLATEALLL